MYSNSDYIPTVIVSNLFDIVFSSFSVTPDDASTHAAKLKFQKFVFIQTKLLQLIRPTLHSNL